MSNTLTKFVFDKLNVPNAQKFLDLAALRHKLIAGNIANVSTPGYRTRDIDFKAEFAKATGNTNSIAGTVTHKGHIPTGNHKSRAPEVDAVKVKVDELNSVDIDKEISNLAQNELLFTAGAKLLQKKFAGLREAIKSR